MSIKCVWTSLSSGMKQLGLQIHQEHRIFALLLPFRYPSKGKVYDGSEIIVKLISLGFYTRFLAKLKKRKLYKGRSQIWRNTDKSKLISQRLLKNS